MPAGRPRKPTALKQLQGTARKDRLNPHEPQPKADRIPPCPAWLSIEAKREWRKLAPELHRLGVLTEVDGSALAAYCQSWARWRAAEEVIEAKGMTMEVYDFDRKGDAYLVKASPRPEVAISQRERQIMRTYLVGFGLDPASRSKVVATPTKADDPFEEFLTRGRRSS